MQKTITISPSALEACKNVEAVIIATEWNEFKVIEWQKVYDNMNKPAFVFDGRLIVDAAKLRQIGFKVRACRPPRSSAHALRVGYHHWTWREAVDAARTLYAS